MSELTISLVVADRPYKLVVEKEHEELFRKASKLIETRLRDYSSSYAYKDKQDLLAMVALEFATGQLRDQLLAEEQEREREQKLKEIDSALSEILN